MEHLAILSKEQKLLAKILDGTKTIESRWYRFRKTPYENISENDIVYFKESGEPVTAMARVGRVLFFNNLNEDKIISILGKYGKQIGIPVEYSKKLICKKFCTLIFLKDIKKIEPFKINKKGYGLMAAWITLDSIKKIQQ